jgi:uncharacterized DUF497 family protein
LRGTGCQYTLREVGGTHCAKVYMGPQEGSSQPGRTQVSFDSVQTVFDDPKAQVLLDDDATEERWRITGMTSDGTLLFVVYTERDDDADIIIHIISARKATRRERETYFANG